jgi:D-alanine transaminase
MPEALPTCLLNGEFVATDTARISPFDRGFLFGDGVYEVIPCYGGRPLRLAAHLCRLAASLAAIGVKNPHSESEWSRLIATLIENNGGGDLGVYLEITRGAQPGRDFSPHPDTTPTVFGFAWSLDAPDPRKLERGVRGVTLEDIRWLRCDVKAVSLLATVLLRREAKARGGDEAVLVREGLLTEGSSSALFAIKQGVIVTPPADRKRLPSITREVVGDAIGALGLTLTERDLKASELASMDEVWIASASREVLALTRLDGQPIGNGTPGPLWRKVHTQFQALKQRECNT